MNDTISTTSSDETNSSQPLENVDNKSEKPEEFGGAKGLEPTRYGDWEKNGRCIDF